MVARVYWTSLNPTWVLADDPVPVWSKLRDSKRDSFQELDRCPAMNKHMRNYFGIRSEYSIEFSYDNENNSYSTDDIDLFQNRIVHRNQTDNLWTFQHNLAFFTPEDSLEMTANLPALYEDNFAATHAMPVSGKMDIGRWFRPTEFAFYLRGSEWKVNYGDIYQYLYFNTNEKIEFVKFAPTPMVEFYLRSVSQEHSSRKRKPMEWFYDHFGRGLKKNILKEIDNSVV